MSERMWGCWCCKAEKGEEDTRSEEEEITDAILMRVLGIHPNEWASLGFYGFIKSVSV